MIFVDRNTVDEPLSLALPNGKGAKERARAIKHYAALATPPVLAKAKATKNSGKKTKATAPKKFNFAAYRCKDVKQTLDNLFHEKCAYCESSYKAVMSAQVEHFRPKGRVSEDSSHKGYWWLASTWTNLLPSCSHCNTSEYHEVHKLTVEQPYPQKTHTGRYKLGKYDYFPIGGQRAVAEGDDLDREDAYLIDPTRRNPNDHLQWIVEGGLSLIAPERVGTAWDPYGLHTYQIFGLNRKKLVETRTTLMLEVKKQLLKARNALMKAATKEPGEFFDYLYNHAMEIFVELDELKAPSKPYSAMVKKLLDEERTEIMAAFMALARRP
ncbi:hypothetical protein ACQKPC_22495 [Pseudomonas sp. NPDC089918]|uniref:hypothetical protein n=1 Tax=Pseudomonas sp. NPDC089918 TaxID=3390654 RepID=UPI003CFEA55C